MTVEAGQVYTKLCPFDAVETDEQIEILEVKPAANGKPAALVRNLKSDYEHGVYIVNECIDGYVLGERIYKTITVEAGQVYNKLCPFDGIKLSEQIEILEVKRGFNGEPAALVQDIKTGYKHGVYIDDGCLDGYILGIRKADSKAVTLDEHIEKYHNGKRANFARAQGVMPQQVNKWLSGEWNCS